MSDGPQPQDAESLENSAMQYLRHGDYCNAARAFEAAMELYKSNGNAKQAHCLYQLSACYAFEDPDKEEPCLKEALAMAAMEDQELQALCCLNLGACVKNRDPKLATDYLHRALELFQTLNVSGWWPGLCHKNLADLASGEDMDTARVHLITAVDEFESARLQRPTDVSLQQARCLEQLGDSAAKHNNAREAVSHYVSAFLRLENRELPGRDSLRKKLESAGIAVDDSTSMNNRRVIRSFQSVDSANKNVLVSEGSFITDIKCVTRDNVPGADADEFWCNGRKLLTTGSVAFDCTVPVSIYSNTPSE